MFELLKFLYAFREIPHVEPVPKEVFMEQFNRSRFSAFLVHSQVDFAGSTFTQYPQEFEVVQRCSIRGIRLGKR